MGSKNEPGTFDCYTKAEPDEPMFVLLARDASAPALVRRWAEQRQFTEGEMAKVKEAMDCADAMEQWRVRNR